MRYILDPHRSPRKVYFGKVVVYLVLVALGIVVGLVLASKYIERYMLTRSVEAYQMPIDKESVKFAPVFMDWEIQQTYNPQKERQYD